MTPQPTQIFLPKQFSIANVEKKPLSNNSDIYTGIIHGNDGERYDFTIMANSYFLDFMKTWARNPDPDSPSPDPADLKKSGIVTLAANDSKKKRILQWEGKAWINGFNPLLESPESKTGKAILKALAAQLPAQLKQNSEPTPVL